MTRNLIAARVVICAILSTALAVGIYGIWVVTSQSYTHGPDMRIVRTIVTVTGPEAVNWGWTLVCGSIAASAWAAVAFPMRKPKAMTLGLAIAALAAVVAACALQRPLSLPFKLWSTGLIVFHVAAIVVLWRDPHLVS